MTRRIERKQEQAGAPPSARPFFGPRWIWVIQTIVFLGGGPFFLFPHRVLPLFLSQPLDPREDLTLAYDGFAMLGVHATSVGLFTLFALMIGDPAARRRLARAFVVFLSFWCATVVWNTHETPDAYGKGALGLLVVAGACVLGNLPWTLRRLPDETGAIDRGHVASAPSWTWPAWLGTALAAFASGLVVFACAEPVLRIWAVPGPDSFALTLAWQQVRFVGAYLMSWGALAVGQARSDREDLWRPLAGLLGVWPICAVALALIRWDPETYRWPAYASLAAFALFGVVAVAAWRAPAIPWAADVSEPLFGWTWEDLVAGPMMALQTLTTKRRASHLVGVAARGTLTVTDDPRRPANAFFPVGAALPLVARFANLTEKDDAALDVRGGSISVTSTDGTERFDMVMNTGSAAPIRHVVQFAGFVASKFLPTFGSELIVKSNRLAREGGIVGLRRAPSSFTRLYFSSQIVRWWMEPGGALHLARYRLAPEDLGAESGLPGPDDVKHIWDRGRLPDAEGGPTYLRSELLDRVRHHAPVKLRLQVQLKPGHTDLEREWYDATVDWPEDDHPWMDVGVVALTDALSPEDCERLAFDPWNHPASFGVPPSDSIFDPRSLGDSEARVMSMLQSLRGWMYRRLGLPKVGP
jgi:hypothetical protein